MVVPLNEGDAREAIRALVDDPVDAIAISLLNAWRNPVHEEAVARLVAEADPDGRVFVSLGSRL